MRRPKKIGAYRLGLRPRNHNSERDTESILQMIIKLDLQDAPTVGSNELRAETLFDQLIFSPLLYIYIDHTAWTLAQEKGVAFLLFPI